MKKAAFVLVLLCTIGVVIALRWKVVNEGRPINPSPLSQIGTKTAEEWFADAVAAYGKGDRESALELAGFARTAGGEPQLIGQVCNLRGIIHFEKGENPEAVAEFLTAIRNDKTNAGYFFNWAEALRAEGHSAAAVPPMRVAAELRPKDLLTRVKLHFLLIESGQGETIARDINQLSEEGGLGLDAAFVKAALLHLNGQEKESAELLSKLKGSAPPELYELCLKDRLFQKKSK